MMKRSVSFNHMAPPDWLAGAGNRNLNARQGIQDLRNSGKEKMKNSTCSSAFIIIKNTFTQKLANHTWIDSPFNIDHQSNIYLT